MNFELVPKETKLILCFIQHGDVLLQTGASCHLTHLKVTATGRGMNLVVWDLSVDLRSCVRHCIQSDYF